MNPADAAAIWLTAKLAVVTTVILLVLSTPLAWWIAHTKSRARVVIEAIVALPLVLPPTVLGFYLLVLLSPQNSVGSWWKSVFGESIVFSFAGLVFGSLIYSLPFAVGPLRDSFSAMGRRPLEAAAMLGASPLRRFITVALPMARAGYLTAGVLVFAHTLGEFGIVLMIGGNIPGRTQVVSTLIYNHVEALRFGEAHALAAALVAVSFAILIIVYAVNRRAARFRF